MFCARRVWLCFMPLSFNSMQDVCGCLYTLNVCVHQFGMRIRFTLFLSQFPVIIHVYLS